MKGHASAPGLANIMADAGMAPASMGMCAANVSYFDVTLAIHKPLIY